MILITLCLKKNSSCFTFYFITCNKKISSYFNLKKTRKQFLIQRKLKGFMINTFYIIVDNLVRSALAYKWNSTI